MKHPPYHLRVNKAIDRFLLVEILDILKRHWDLSDYTYYGFGGPFLEDCRLIHNRCPEIKIVSIETNQQTFKRQQFHRFSKNLDLRDENFESFLAHFSSNGGEIFWLDYTDLKFGHFDEFMSILGKVSENSVVKITVRAESDNNDWEDFQKKFGQILPPSARQTDIKRPFPFVKLLQEMFKLASQQALPASGESVFQLLDSSYYSDQTHMVSITGIVCNKNEVSKIRQWFNNWKFKNLDWTAPRKIDVPILSIKERLHLEKYLPTETDSSIVTMLWNGVRAHPCGLSSHFEKLKQYDRISPHQ